MTAHSHLIHRFWLLCLVPLVVPMAFLPLKWLAVVAIVGLGALLWRKAAIAALFLIPATLSAQPAVNWAGGFGGTTLDFGEAVTTDASGNIFIAGEFSGTANFGATVLTSNGGLDLFIAKLSSSGSVVWAKSFGSTGDETSKSIALDTNGNIFLGGYFTGTGNFGGTNQVSAGNSDIFLAKYDSSGNHVWSQHFGSTDLDALYGLAVDSQGSVAITGSFRQIVNFGGTNFNAIFGGDTGFIAKYTSAGSHIWSQPFAGGNANYGKAIAADKSDNLLVAGYYNLNINFGHGVITAPSPSSANMFLAKFNSAGSNVWAFGHGNNNTVTTASIAADSSGNALVIGQFHASTDLGGGTLNGTGIFSDGFVAKYSSGGSFIWAKPLTSTLGMFALSVAVAPDDSVALSGYFYGTGTFGGSSFPSVSGSYDAMLAKYSSAGATLWARSFGAAGTDQGNSVTIDKDGSTILAGVFQFSVPFGGTTLVSAGSYDVFAVKLFADNAAARVVARVTDLHVATSKTGP